MSIFEDSIHDVYKKGFYEEMTAGSDMYKRVKSFYKSYAGFKNKAIPATVKPDSALGEYISHIEAREGLDYEKVRPSIPPELYDKRPLAYHTVPPKRNYDVSEIQLRTLYNQRDFNDLDEDFVKSITENYAVRSMSEFARQYGFYSTFIVGEEHTYFVYGIDNEFINTTKFVEHNETLFPYEYVRENGYCRDEFWLSFYWNVLSIDHFKDPEYRGTCLNQFAAVEFLRFAYEDAGMPLPCFVAMGVGETVRFLKIRHWMATTKKFSGSIKEHYRNVFIKTLEDIAIWNFPIKKPKDCGFLAFTLGSRYNAISYLSYSDKEFIYRNEHRWEAALKAAENVSQKSFLDMEFSEDEAKFIMAFMRGKGVPCREVKTRSDLEDKETDMVYDNFLTESERFYYDARDVRKCLRFCTFDLGLVEYLEEEYTEHVLSDECMDYGDMLLREMTEEDPNDTTSHTGLVVQLVRIHDLPRTIRMMASCHINMGHPRDWRFRFPYSKGIYFVTPYYNIAYAVSNYPLRNDASHIYNTSDEIYDELRSFSPAYDGRMWRANDLQEKEHKGYAERSYTNDLVKRGMLVSNDGMDIPVADDDTLRGV